MHITSILIVVLICSIGNCVDHASGKDLHVLWNLKDKNYIPQNDLFVSVDSFQNALRAYHMDLSMGPEFRFVQDNQTTSQSGSNITDPFESDLCLNSTFDAVTQYVNQTLLGFRGEYHWVFANDLGIFPSYPQRNDVRFQANTVTAAVLRGDHLILFHDANQLSTFDTRINDFRISTGSVASNYSTLTGHLPVTAAFEGDKDEFFLVTRDSRLWTVQGNSAVENGTLQETYSWNELDSGFRDTFSNLYFFRNETYVRIENSTKKVATHMLPAYPRTTGIFFIFCRDPFLLSTVGGVNKVELSRTLCYILMVLFLLNTLSIGSQ